jgi:aminomethyltransferase
VTNQIPTESASTEQEPRFSPLHAIHVACGASFTDFAGWQMPVSYGSDLAEHHAVRTAAGIFDISHMAEIRVVGTDAGAFLDYALAGKLSVIAPLQAKYTLLLAADGGIVDDLIVYCRGDNEYLVVANAGNRFAAVAALTQRAADFAELRIAAPSMEAVDLEIVDLSDDISLIAVQGPETRAILEATASLPVDAGQPALADLKYYWSTNATFAGGAVFIGRTGYTGEDGFELYVNVADAAALWNALIAAGTPRGLIPAGLASRDTLRLEAGMPLYGHELGLDTFPVQAGLGKVVALSKEGDFVGRAAVEAGPPATPSAIVSAPVTADGPAGARVLIGLTTDGKRAGRAGYPIFRGDTEVGIITSGALSPTLGYPIAMAYVDPAAAAAGAETPGTLSVDVRGTRIPATVVPLPFYKREKK